MKMVPVPIERMQGGNCPGYTNKEDEKCNATWDRRLAHEMLYYESGRSYNEVTSAKGVGVARKG